MSWYSLALKRVLVEAGEKETLELEDGGVVHLEPDGWRQCGWLAIWGDFGVTWTWTGWGGRCPFWFNSINSCLPTDSRLTAV